MNRLFGQNTMNRLFGHNPMSSQLSPISGTILALKITTAIALWVPVIALGQTPGRNLSGMVKSSSGSPIPSAQISVKNLVSGNTFSAKVGEDGSYKLMNLPPGN